MKKRQHVLPCGRVIYYNETTPRDIGTQATMLKRLHASRKKLEALYPYDNAGRRKIYWAGAVYNKFTTSLVELLVHHLLSGDRVETLNGHKWMIANRGDSRHVNWHTDGVSYGVAIQGISGKFGIRLSKKARKELQRRIMSGQNYHIIDGRIQ